MSENKTSRYFKYAVGEIILVVIGILIALQINNWNENRKEKNYEKKLVYQLLEDARNDSVFYKSRILLFDKQLTTYQKLMDYCNGKIKNSDSITFYEQDYPFTQSANQSMVINNANDYNKITNDVIKKALRNTNLSFGFVSISYQQHSQLVDNETSYLSKKYDIISSFDEFKLEDFAPACSDSEIPGTLKLCYFSSLSAKIQSERFFNDITTLINASKNYLND